jgi:two-component sensor histidine kinase
LHHGLLARDVTDRKQLEERLNEGTIELRRSLAETTTLLKEVHHRVKNNLQVICSLLSMQIACSDSFSQPLSDAHSRVLSMSLIHEQIYQSETLADLNFGTYIDALSAKLFGAYCVDPSRIRLELSVEPISFSVDQAIPCGLILNELISNSLKHAFSDGRKGVIRVSLRETEDRFVELVVSDNGVGLPVDFRLEQCQTRGLRVVSTLIRQLRADLSVVGGDGATFRFGWKRPDAVNLEVTATGVRTIPQSAFAYPPEAVRHQTISPTRGNPVDGNERVPAVYEVSGSLA